MTRGMELGEAQPRAPSRWSWKQHLQATCSQPGGTTKLPFLQSLTHRPFKIMTSVCLQDGSIPGIGNSQDVDTLSEKEGGVLDIWREGVMEGLVLGALTQWQV